ncbi:MAG TPA: carbamoyltransferase HypF [Terriglobales bacterium]|nr:carbamoyltransferase HypF [Terriglobales bacterium]
MAVHSQPEAVSTDRRLRVVIRGAVQGVGFRPFVYRLAAEMGLPGWVENSSSGVFIEVEGTDEQLGAFLRRLESEKPAISFIQSLESSYLDAVGFKSFEIRESSGGEKTAIILPDLAICPDCLREIDDPANRRYRYPFTNCTNCGPRFTIIESLPYDRPRTTMRAFIMCAECEREYNDPADRRFHAQPNACAACGPQLELWDAGGSKIGVGDEALLTAAQQIRIGGIAAVKGLGGFHLIVDARSDSAVRELRSRKRREEKPLALMLPSADSALEYCECSELELRMLRSPESPVVLLRRRERLDGLAASVAPGNPFLGVMLPYTPLHHLLMQELGFPVVATSGNLSEEPICTDEQEAVLRLGGIADFFLVHNRPILRHVDDSVVRAMAGREMILRRARGFAPLPVKVRDAGPTVVGVGPHQKNTIASSVRDQVYVSQHIGDLETAQSLDAFERVNTAFCSLYELKPEAMACDMHPDYLSSQYARRMPMIPVIAVQHHHAHVLACMAENDLEPPVLGVAWDGSGFGPDGTIWGGEFLHVTHTGYERFAHLRTFRLPGGERAVKEPRRAALALLYEVFGDQAFEMDIAPVRSFKPEQLRVLKGMLRRDLNAPVTSSMGRLFDAVAAMAGIRQVCGFEGQAAMELEFSAVSFGSSESYEFDIRRDGEGYVLDWEPMVRVIVAEPAPAGKVAKRFHMTLAGLVSEVAKQSGLHRVVLSGGCFQNRVLTESVVTNLQQAGFQPYWHQRIPPNDGGISLGQVIAARAELARTRQDGELRR